uniref:Uncharacterized protein n=1 Tax=Arundo donax TaxID=35708 RepID=A0A0A9BN06_ARUDO
MVLLLQRLIFFCTLLLVRPDFSELLKQGEHCSHTPP